MREPSHLSHLHRLARHHFEDDIAAHLGRERIAARIASRGLDRLVRPSSFSSLFAVRVTDGRSAGAFAQEAANEDVVLAQGHALLHVDRRAVREPRAAVADHRGRFGLEVGAAGGAA